MVERFRPFCAVYSILLKDRRIFMIRRFNTGWQDGSYGLPAGHLDGNETITCAAVREAKEEVGVEILEQDLKIAHVMHRIRKGEREYIDFFFVAEKWIGNPYNAEQDKADDAQWFLIDALPENVVRSVRFALDNFQKGIIFSEFGWKGEFD